MPTGEKKDRRARLLRVEHLLYQNPSGLTPHEVARICDVCVRTSYRDLRALHNELKVPLWQDHRRYGITPGYYLPPIKLNLLEAMALFLSARLASRYADERDPNIEGVFSKLASVLPPPISQHVQETIASMAERPPNTDFERVFDILTSSWASRRRVRIWYRHTKPDGSAQQCHDRLLDPYFIEPSGTGHSCYVIGYDHHSHEVRTFKIERISEIELTKEEYAIPCDWRANDYLKGSWGIFHDEEVEVQILFSPAVVRRVKEATWHPSQQLEDRPDGSSLVTVRVGGTLEITPWILSWGAEAEVIAPLTLRAQIGNIAQRLAAAYGMVGCQTNIEPF